MKYVSFIESKIRWRCWSRVCRFQAARSADARSSEMIISDAIIWIMRDALRRGNTYGSQPGQWITLKGCISFLSTSFPRCFCCFYCNQSAKKRSLTSLVLRRPIVESSSIWTVIHKSQTCILVHADQRDNQNRHELRDSSASRRNNSNMDIVNFSFELILHYCELWICFLCISTLLLTL